MTRAALPPPRPAAPPPPATPRPAAPPLQSALPLPSAPPPVQSAPDAIRVMICDDSAVVRLALARLLEGEPGIALVPGVPNGQRALEAVRRQKVEILLLDIEMPVMDGLTALPLLLREDPAMRVIVASALTTRGAATALRALQLGAADYLPKPDVATIADAGFRRELLGKIRGLARARPARSATAVRAALPLAAVAQPAFALRAAPRQPPLLLAIGCSTGGPQALSTLLQGLAAGGTAGLPRGVPVPVPVPVLVTQHMPAAFLPTLAAHLGRLGALPCVIAEEGMTLEPGRVHLAPGDRHLTVERDGDTLRARLSAAPPEHFCRPAVDPMLRSAAASCGGRVLVAMLTGMGQDGLAGTRAVVDAGGAALAQDAATSVVWGMPGAVAQAGLCHRVLGLPELAPCVTRLLRPAGS